MTPSRRAASSFRLTERGGLRGLDGPHELPAHRAVGSAGDQLVRLGRVEAPRPQIRESSASGGVERHTPGLTILAETHLVSRSTSAHRAAPARTIGGPC